MSTPYAKNLADVTISRESPPADDMEDQIPANVTITQHQAGMFGVSYPDFTAFALVHVINQFRKSMEDPESNGLFFTSFDATLPFHEFEFSRDTLHMLSLPNAGGHSENSEALSFEYFYRLFGARLRKAEMEIVYDNQNFKKTDYTCTLFGHHVGVSVTRAVGYPNPDSFGPTEARALLSKKLFGICVSNVGVSGEEKWERQILHVWVQNSKCARLIEDVFSSLHPGLRGNTIVIVTVAGNHKWIFS